MRLWRKLRFWFRRRRFDEELTEEMRLHRHLRARRLISDGLEPELARREANRQFGNELSLREESRDIWILRWLEDAVQDFRFTARMIGKRREPFAYRPDDDVEKALDSMSLYQVRRIPVVGAGGELVGIISQADVATRIHRPEKAGAMLGHISSPSTLKAA